MNSRLLKNLVCLFLFASAVSRTAHSEISSSCTYSSLWGISGEKWRAEGRLPDFSYAGYHAGEASIPNLPAKWDFRRDFHAKGDGRTDDSAALLNAVQSIDHGVLFIPEGTYVFAKRIDISKSNFVLRGAGPGKTILLFPNSLTDLFGNKPNGAQQSQWSFGPGLTILLFPNSLTDLFGNKPNGAQQSQWSFGPGLINVTGKDPINAATRLASITAPAKRGDKTLQISNQISASKGEWIRLSERDPQKGDAASGSLIHYLYGDLMPPGTDLIGTAHIVRFLSRVKLVSGNKIELERPLPYEVRHEWSPEVHRFAPMVQEVGIEHLSIHFPW